jgi:hypothetical protein
VAVQVARAAEHPNRGREWLERPRSRRPGTPAGLVLPAAALRPARHRRLRSIAARPAAAVGGVHRGTGRGHGRDRLAAGRAAGHGPQAGPLGLFFAGTRPERTSALILADATARYLAADDYPIGFSSEAAEATIARAEEPWGSEAYAGSVRRAGPATSGSCAGRPGSSGPSPAHGWSGPICGPCCRSTSAPILPLIQAPTLVLAHREFQQLPVEHGRYLGEHITGARLVELPGDLPRGETQPELGAWGGRGVPDRGSPRRRARSRVGHRAVHRHRRLHPAGRRVGRPGIAGPCCRT